MKRKLFLQTLLIFIVNCSAYSAVIDDMDTQWNTATDSTATINVTVTGGTHKLDYDFTPGGEWVEIYNDNLLKLDVSAGDSFRFDFKGSGSSNKMNLQVYDADGDTFSRTFSGITGISEWTQFTVPFVSMSSWTGTSGDGVLDTAAITKIAFAVAPVTGGSGSIAVDDIKRYDLNTAEYLLVSSFDFGTPPNETGGNEGVWSGGGGSDPSSSYAPGYNSIYSVQLTYDYTGGGYGGYYIKLDHDEELSIDGYTHMKFWLKSDFPGKSFKLELKDKDNNVSTFTVTNTKDVWEEISIQLSNMANFSTIVSSAAKEIVLTFDKNPKVGIVYIDDLRFTTSAAYTGKEISTVDDMDTRCDLSGWAEYGLAEDSGITTVDLESIDGNNGSAIELDYSFNRAAVNVNDWVVMEREWGLNLAAVDSLKVRYKGTGADNNIEVKMEDANGTRFWRKLFKVTDTSGDWKELDLAINDFSFFTAGANGEEEINLKRLKGLYFTISKNEGSSGTVYVDTIEDIIKKSYEAVRTGKIIRNINIEDNPFSPNNDGVADRIKFSLTLSASADVRLIIYDLSGSKVYETESGNKSAGTEFSIYWNGKDDFGGIVKNGLYLYSITAETASGNDRIDHVLGVYR
ncbi:MAG: carbohydrate binding domain-containing protein [Elusimicrobiota bacterium]